MENCARHTCSLIYSRNSECTTVLKGYFGMSKHAPITGFKMPILKWRRWTTENRAVSGVGQWSLRCPDIQRARPQDDPGVFAA